MRTTVATALPFAILFTAACGISSENEDASPRPTPVEVSDEDGRPQPVPFDTEEVEEPEPIDLQLEAPASAGKYDPVLSRDKAQTRDAVEPRPGQLTAGEWRDLDHWAHWEELLVDTQDEHQTDYQQYERDWGFRTRTRQSVLVVDPTGAPVVDAVVQLMADGDDQPVWMSRTDNLGRAELFDGVFERTKDVDKTIVVQRSGVSARATPAGGDARQTIALPSAPDSPRAAADIMFVVDTTGSMGDELHYLKSELKDVVQKVKRDQGELDVRLSVNFYRDQGDRYVVRPYPFTTDVLEVVRQIGKQDANGGGDTPEAIDQALADAIDDHQWSNDARARLAFLVLDAPAHQRAPVLERYRNATRAAAAKGVRLIPVMGSGIGKETEFLMRFTAIATGGTYIFLTSHSGIGDSHIKPTIGPHDVEYLNDLLIRVITSYIE